jgi:hypothetical protein
LILFKKEKMNEVINKKKFAFMTAFLITL